MNGSSRQAIWIAFFAVACEPSATTQSNAAVPIGTTAEQVAAEVPAVKTKTGESPANTGDKTMFVREQRIDCEGEGPMLCMQVRDAGSDEWTLFYGRIEGFTYEEGYAYELRVKVEEVKRPKADASSKRFKLVEIVSKKKVAEH
jgi:hypothetical protein